MNKLKEGLKTIRLEPLVFVLPLLLFVSIFILLPVLGTFLTSLYQDVTFLPRKFVFFKNYKQLFQDSGFLTALRFTLFFTIISVALELIFGLFTALLLNLNLWYKNFLRIIILLPWVIPTAVSGRIWQLIFNYNYGLANFVIKNLGISSEPVNWLGSDLGAFSAITIADVWKTTPFVALILLVGLQTIPEELHRQGKVDGANIYQRFFKITLPNLKTFIIVSLLFRTIDALRVFDTIYILTGGGPGGSTTSLSLYSYNFFNSSDFGYSSAISVILFLIAFTISIYYLKISRFRQEIA